MWAHFQRTVAVEIFPACKNTNTVLPLDAVKSMATVKLSCVLVGDGAHHHLKQMYQYLQMGAHSQLLSTDTEKLINDCTRQGICTTIQTKCLLRCTSLATLSNQNADRLELTFNALFKSDMVWSYYSDSHAVEQQYFRFGYLLVTLLLISVNFSK